MEILFNHKHQEIGWGDVNLGQKGVYMQERRFVAVVGEWEGVKDLVGLVNVYGPRDHRKRKEVWNMVELLCKKRGDFNVVRRDHERLNSFTNARQVEAFNDFMQRSLSLEVWMGNQKFTSTTTQMTNSGGFPTDF
ncbi:hypothetical protein OSB04_027522 [Centaurea solstitialis]|uniref:Uncharacterized protein n=1 Tax=Centaurea solstitialis TaxID=347529 RepID=A0AA38SR07_9ASTR|nr:hypothetical protein OSB04_027522 [Centaurea solstitialis]